MQEVGYKSELRQTGASEQFRDSSGRKLPPPITGSGHVYRSVNFFFHFYCPSLLASLFFFPMLSWVNRIF